MRWTYRCSECGTRYPISPEVMVCPACSADRRPGQPYRGILEVQWEDDTPDRSASTAMATAVTGGDTDAALPFAPRFFPPIPVGNTPLWHPRRLRDELGLPHLTLKDDTVNPTKSFKDRASRVVAACARRFGIPRVVVASTGNAASSMAGVGAAAGVEVVVFVPRHAPKAKLIQCLQYGARVNRVDGSYTDAVNASLDYVARHGGLSRNTGYNPLTIEGKKSAAFEIVNQLGAPPDHLFVPTGDGVILAGLYKGFADLIKLGITQRMPTIHAVQAAGSAAIAHALTAAPTGDRLPPFTPIAADTLADSISVDVPAAGYYVVRQLIAYKGRVHVVTDEEILAAQALLSRTSGLFAEPAAAASVAGLIAARTTLDPNETIVLMITGSGLKDIENAAKGVDAPL